MSEARSGRQVHRDVLEKSLTTSEGGDVEALYASWAARRRACPFEHVRAEDRTSVLGPQRNTAGTALEDVYVAWSHGLVGRVMRDGETFSKPGPGRPFDDTLLSMNGIAHQQYRELVQDAFAPAAIGRWEQTLIEPLMHRLVDQFVSNGRADLVRDYTSHFPFHVIRTLLGFAEEDHDTFIGLAYPHSDGDGVVFGPEWESALRAFLQPRIDAARRRPGDNLLGLLVRAELDGERLSEDQLYRFLVLLIPAGADTTFAGASNLWCGLLTHPDQLELLRTEPRLIARAADEALRWNNSAAASFLRVALRPTEIEGVSIPAGTLIACHVSAHNRDEDHYPEPDQFDITRPKPPSGIFGYGAHACLGMHLARSEMKTSVRVALARLRNLRLDPDQPWPHVQTGLSFFPSPSSLPVLFEADGFTGERAP